jgi:hypothetical protein
MFDRVVSELVGEVAGVLAGLDPGSVPLREVESVWAAFDRIERLVASAKLRLASRVEAGSWRRAGRRSAADHLALLSGTSVGAARGALEASKHLKALPVVSQAVASGLLSASQATVITDAAAVAPQAQTDLVAAAGRESLSELRDRCGRAKAAADREADTRHRRIHAARFLRKRACADGAAELSYRSTPEEVAEVFAVAERLAEAHLGRWRAVHGAPRCGGCTNGSRGAGTLRSDDVHGLGPGGPSLRSRADRPAGRRGHAARQLARITR